MGQICTICSHPQSLEIDAAIGRGEPGRAIAREFALSEGALRRHKFGHLSERSPDVEPDAPLRAAELSTDPEAPDDVRAVARRRLEAEEAASRAGRLAAFEADEQNRRDRARREQERAAALEAARAEAAEMAARRADLEDRAEAELRPLRRTLEMLEILDKNQTALLSRFGLLPFGQQPVTGLVQYWLRVRLGNFSPGGSIPAAMDPHRGAPLRERDPLTKAPDTREPTKPPPAA